MRGCPAHWALLVSCALCLLVSGSLSFTACVCTHVVGRATLWWCECGFGQEQWGEAPGDHVGVGAGALSPIRVRPSRLFPYVECACRDSCAPCSLLCVMCGAVDDGCCTLLPPFPPLQLLWPSSCLCTEAHGRRRALYQQETSWQRTISWDPAWSHSSRYTPTCSAWLGSLTSLPPFWRGLEVLVASF